MSEEKKDVVLLVVVVEEEEGRGEMWPWPVKEVFMNECRARAAREDTVNDVVLEEVLLVKEGGGVYIRSSSEDWEYVAELLRKVEVIVWEMVPSATEAVYVFMQ